MRRIFQQVCTVAIWALACLMCGLVNGASGTSAAPGSKRLALVMGNDAYQNVGKLEKAGNDAEAMARELRAAGFEVTLERDLNYRSMVKRLDFFTSHVGGGDQVVVFYAGHGVQLRSGSYLLPTDIEANSESEIEKTSVALNDVLDKLNEAKAAFALVMVDACRDNPLKSNGRSLGSTRGLSAIEPPKGQMVVYSASKGQQALDKLNAKDTNPNGVFTREFIARMKRPGVRIEDLVREVQDSVEDLARSIGHDQRPALYNEARGNFYFFGPTTVQVQSNAELPTRARSKEQIEDDFWDSIKTSADASSFEEYLKAYPNGRYAGQARIGLSRARTSAQRPAPSLPPSPASSPLPGDPETAFWNEVKSSNTRDYFDAYLQQYPRGKFVALARLELKKLEERDQAERERLSLQRQQEEQASWDNAKRLNTDAAFAAYLAAYPQGRYIALASATQQRLRREERERQDAQRADLSKAAASVVTIAHVGPTSGAIAHLGRDNENGAILAVEEINAAGLQIGANRVTLKLVTQDDGADPKTGVLVAKNLVDLKVSGVIGHLNSGTSIPASKLYSDAGIPQISPSATNPKYTRQGFKTTFRVVADDAQLGRSLGRIAVNSLKARTVAVIDDRTAYGQGIADEFGRGVTAAGGLVLAREFTNDKASDFNAILTSIRDKRPDLVFFGGMDSVAGPMLRQMRQLGINAKFLGGDGICSTDLVRLAGDAISDNQVYCGEAGGVEARDKAGMENFKSRFKARFGSDVVVYAPYVYDSVKLMVAAMVRAGSAEPAKYLPQLAATNDYRGVTGPIGFDEKGDLKSGALTLKSIRGGRLEDIAVLR